MLDKTVSSHGARGSNERIETKPSDERCRVGSRDSSERNLDITEVNAVSDQGTPPQQMGLTPCEERCRKQANTNKERHKALPKATAVSGQEMRRYQRPKAVSGQETHPKYKSKDTELQTTPCRIKRLSRKKNPMLRRRRPKLRRTK
jgi:hypothetical protein